MFNLEIKCKTIKEIKNYISTYIFFNLLFDIIYAKVIFEFKLVKQIVFL